jgi:D-alanine transaminase
MISYFNGLFLGLSEIKISPFDRGFLFADGVYESIRTYNRKLFRYKDHLTRLKRSLREIRLEYNAADDLERTIYELIEKNKIENEALVYLQITRGAVFPRTHGFPNEGTEPTVFISVQELKEKQKGHTEGIKVILQDDIRWTRCDIKSVSLLPVVLANQNAIEVNAEEAVFVRGGLITEGTHTNFFAIKNDVVITAPLTNLILDGVTRKVVFEVCKKVGIKIIEDYIKHDELKNYDEFFITSTTKEITPVVKIDDMIIGNMMPGEFTARLQSEFKKVTKEQ